MKLGIFVTALFLAALPMTGGTLFTTVDPSQPTPITAGTYGPGATLTITATGTVNLNGPAGNPIGLIVTNPDGSLSSPASISCTGCWSPGYQYFLQGSSSYPIINGQGNGVNNFVGGGGNYDLFPGSHSPWAPEGKQTTDTSDPGALRFGTLAYTFVNNPSPTDWHPLVLPQGGGVFGNTISSGSGGTLQLVVVDTFYPNDSGGYVVTINGPDVIPEPSAMVLSLSGAALLGFIRFARRRRAQ